MNGGSNLRINSHKQPFSRTDNLLPNSTGLLICKSSGKLFEEAKIHSRQQKSTQRNEERERGELTLDPNIISEMSREGGKL